MLELVRRYRPRVKLVDRHTVAWMRVPGELVRPLVGDVNGRFTTVLGDTVYLPGPVDRFDRDTLAAILAHELVHQLDQAQFGPWFYGSYVLVAPSLRTMRAHWERRAYAVDLMLAYERSGAAGLELTRQRLIPIFAGFSYAWMWAGPEAAARYLQPVVNEVVDGSLVARDPYREILAAWRGRGKTPEEAA